MVAAYAKQELGDAINMEVFRYPEDFSEYLEKTTPDIACFSVFSWNQNLAHRYAAEIKSFSPNTITIFGGVNFPTESEEKKDYLTRFSAIDFFIDGEGELPFVELMKSLERYEYNHQRLQADHLEVSNTCYLVDGELMEGQLGDRIVDLEIIPSPFANGLCDKFFDGRLTPMVQTTRGCPFSCTFCHDGHRYFNKTRRFPMERIREEMEYVAQRAMVNEFIITDLNFGMFPEDVEISRYIGELQEKYNYPRYVVQASAKNHKERILEISELLGGALAPGASVQSTDPDVLKAIKRKNLPYPDLVEVATTRVDHDASSLSEIILCLPNDSKRAHIQSNIDMIDAGMTLLRNHQFMLLMGTEAASKSAREEYMMDTRFRVQPRCFGHYKIRGKNFVAVEVEEICVANKTITYSEYQDCRAFNLTIEIFLNDALFFDLFQFLDRLGIKRSDLVFNIFDRIENDDTSVANLYQQYREEEKINLRNDREEFLKFIDNPDVIDRYIAGELGSNEIYKYRALAVHRNMQALHDIIYKAARNLAKLAPGSKEALYLDELKQFSLLRKEHFLDKNMVLESSFHFDFLTLAEGNFGDDPVKHYHAEPRTIQLYHSKIQKDIIDKWVQQFGTTVNGLARMLSRAQVSAMYRIVCEVESTASQPAAQ